ncbi:MAG: peptidoglycan-associated lipoprotein Pal [Betaproteobacteria bacterium]|jgi:peptidoglycan-associated lipoprotein|nr:peptidoglycan-associated lipoprotein Pal [Betaproteobacteria bacterium]
MKKLLSLLLLVAIFSGCSSNVKLSDVPVEDRSGANPNTASSAVSSLDARGIGSMNGIKPGPAGVSNVVYFDYDSFTVKPEFQSVLEAHARFIKADTTRRANLEGHTDERGGSEYNLALGQKRAEAVRRALNALGVADGQMEAVSYGKEKPAMTGNDEAAFSKNRRAEITYR